MAPTGKHTNEQVRELIIQQARQWFKTGFNITSNAPTKIKFFSFEQKDLGLFHIGKILHRVQDSYSLSHVQRNAKGEVIQFQGYNHQDADKHGEADAQGDSKGAEDAEASSVLILEHYKNSKKNKTAELIYLQELEKILKNNIYAIEQGRESIEAGGTLPEFTGE